MKKLFLSIIVSMITLASYAAFTIPNAKDSASANASEKTAASGKVSREVMEFFIKLSPKEYEFLRGEKMNFFERISFKASQKRVARQLDKESTAAKRSEFNPIGFLAGLVFGFLGLLGAYLFSKDTNLRKWAMIGCGVWLAVLLVILVI